MRGAHGIREVPCVDKSNKGSKKSSYRLIVQSSFVHAVRTAIVHLIPKLAPGCDFSHVQLTCKVVNPVKSAQSLREMQMNQFVSLSEVDVSVSCETVL